MCEPSSGKSSHEPALRQDLHGEIEDLQKRVKELTVVLEALERPSGTVGHPNINASARSILNLRQYRRAIFGPTLFGEPSWDMLLELYDAHLNGRRERVSALCVASGVPASTALRWIDHLEKEGWINRATDPNDLRRPYVELSGRGLDAMTKVLASPCP